MSEYIITADNIKKVYNHKPILQDITLHIKKGSIYGLVGKNGSGKTTLLRIITGMIKRFEGTLAIGEGFKNKQIKLAAMINSPSLFLNKTAYENMKIQAILLGASDNKIYEVLALIQLEHYQDEAVEDFSLGMMQRLRLGMALLANPDILILDEPINGLDPEGITLLRKLIIQINLDYKITVILSSHILGELEQVAKVYGILHNGRIIREVSQTILEEQGLTLEEFFMQSIQEKISYGSYMEE